MRILSHSRVTLDKHINYDTAQSDQRLKLSVDIVVVLMNMLINIAKFSCEAQTKANFQRFQRLSCAL